METTRRELLTGAAVAGAAAAAGITGGIWGGRPASALEPAEGTGYYRFALGDLEITVFSDGNLFIPPANFAVNKTAEELATELRRFGLSPESGASQSNPLLIDDGERKILIDCGSGANFQPTAGRLAANMEAAGVDPADIDMLFITHAHPDHCWGILDDFDENRFADAELVTGRVDWEFWMAEGRASEVPEAMQPFVAGAQRQLSAFDADAVRLVEDGDEVAPGITAMLAPGHTVGHMALHIESAGRRLLCTGDAFNHWLISLAHPDWHLGFDMDKEQAVDTRRRLFDMAATEELEVIGYHMPWPGLGRIIRDGSAHRWIASPMIWG